jgi:transcriptional regulator with XRE-family HTH domain
MGTAGRPKPKRLAGKLKTIREQLGFSHRELIAKLDCSSIPLYKSSISRFENGLREPPLQVLLEYARLANVWVDVLIDDLADLPFELPSENNSGGL